MTERPNKRVLADALDIFRDAMRPFIIRWLRRLRGSTLEGAIASALLDEQYSRFKKSMGDGRSAEEAIDISEFPRLVKVYWRETFRNAFRPGTDPRDSLYAIATARNEVSHPIAEDIDLQDALDCLQRIIEVLADTNQPKESKAVMELRESLAPLKIPAHRFRQGGRDVYAFTLDLWTLNKVLPDRVDDRVVKDANRPLTPSHASNIQRYLQTRDDWLLGSLQLGISGSSVQFAPYAPETEAGTVGELLITSQAATSMRMFDGQHRRRAIKDALEELSQSTRPAEALRLESLGNASLPVMLYVEDSIEALRQMFADAARTRAVESNTVVRFDQTEAFNRAALWIAENSDLFAGRVEMERASVPRSSDKIIAINQLAKTLKTTEVGYKGRISKDRNTEYMLDLDSLYERCLQWADDFMPAARDEYNALMAGDLDNSDIPKERTKTMAYNATVIRILAGCYYEWGKSSGRDWKPLTEFLRSASLTPSSQAGALLVDAGAVAPGGTSPVAQQSQLTEAIDYVVGLARESSWTTIPTTAETAERRPDNDQETSK